MTDLKTPGVAQAVAKNLQADIDQYCVDKYGGRHSKRLGASKIGEKCSRKLQFKFRWVKKEIHDARMLRLFQRGHYEEPIIIKYLESIGCEVWTHDLTNNELYVDPMTLVFFLGKENVPAEFAHSVVRVGQDDKDLLEKALLKGVYVPQFRMSDCNDHFAGFLDSVIQLPKKYEIKKPVLGEFKTQGTGSGFNKLCKDGMAVTKMDHYAQTCTYGVKYDFDHALYIAVNKNDDDMHLELTSLNHKTGERMIEKAWTIIQAKELLPRVSDNPTSYDCQYCQYKEICHFGAEPEKNCRSCKNATAVENAEWRCNLYNAIIPKDVITEGCAEWNPITK